MYKGKDLTKYTERQNADDPWKLRLPWYLPGSDDFSEPNHENRETD